VCGLKNKFKKKLRDNGQSLKWFWAEYLKQKISYQYFIIQVSDVGEIREDVELAITNFMIEKGRK
jgi:hypothetical protein